MQVSSNDETNESDNGEVYHSNHHNDLIADQNSSCDPTVSSTIADDLKEDERTSPIDIYSRSPSKEQELPKNKREWSNSPDGSYRHKRPRVSGSYDRRKLRSPPLQSPRISRPDSDDELKKENESTTTGNELSTTFCPSSPNTPIESPTEMDEDLVELEPILSDEDISDDVNGLDDISEEIFAEEFPTKVFNPFIDDIRVVEQKLTPSEISRIQKVKEQFLIINESYNFDSCTENVDESTWVHICEHINSNLHSLSSQEQVAELLSSLDEPTVEMLRSCIKIGLNHSLAIQHQIPGCNLRHIKAGIRLIECLANCEQFIEHELFQKLFDLLPHHFIPVPIKLLITRLIYHLIDSKKGIEKFLEFDGYKKVIEMLSTVIDVRLLYTLKAILKKIHANETLGNIKTLSIDIYHRVKAGNDLEFDKLTELENIFIALTQTRKLDVMQSKKFIPITSQFEIASGGKVGELTSYYKEHSFLESLTILWDARQMMTPKLLLLMLEYLSMMAKNGEELGYLVNDIRMTNSLLKMLLESDVEDAVKQLNVEVGIEISYKIETKYYVDWISKLSTEIELTESLESFYNLCTGPGRKYVLEYLAMDDNLIVFLNLIDKEKKISMVQGSPGFKQKSPVLSYCIDILDLVVRQVENIDYLIRFDSILLNLVKHHDAFEPSVAAMLQEMSVFLKPLEIEKIFEYEEITPLAEVIKRSMEFLTTFPGDLIMTLRILRHLIVPSSCGDYQELKHDFFAIQLYHADGAVTFLSILEKLANHFDQPMIHSYLLGANQGSLLMQIIHPTVQILRKMLVQVIRSRNISFRDVTAIETLMKTYTLMQSINSRCSTYKEAKKVQEEIIRILLTYTQSLTPDGMTTTNIHKSLWTQMIGEVIKYTLSCPYHFVPGLMVLSELLPLPLPVPVQINGLNKVESQRLITERLLWSAHLHPQSHVITEMIQTFCTSSTPKLNQIIHRVCIQLSDLAPNMTLLVSKAIVELTVTEPLDKNNESTGALSRLFKFLASIVRHSCVKVSVLSILDGKLSELMSQLLNNVSDSNVEHVMTQFQVYMILHNLFDCEISMLFNSAHNPELILASGLPTKELITQFANDVIENFCKTSVENLTFASIRAMILLTEHDATFNILKTCLTKVKDNFVERLNSIAEKCKNDRKQMVMIPDLLEFFRALINIDSNEISAVPPRSISMTSIEIATLFKWNSEEYRNGTKIHFLEVFSALVNEPQTALEDEVIDHSSNLKTDLESLLEQLREASKSEQEQPVVASSDQEINLAQAEGIVTQFSSRVAFYTTEGLEEMTTDYWLLNEGFEFSEDVVQCDLDELVRQYLPSDTNISSDCKRLLALSSSPQSTRERNLSGLCFRTRRVEVVDPIVGRPEKKIFSKCKFSLELLDWSILKDFILIVPPRGRGFSRAVAIRGDIFRSRPPNTSRPPSLHVDDFLAMESGQPSYNKREVMSSSRGRGRGSSFISRGRGVSSYK